MPEELTHEEEEEEERMDEGSLSLCKRSVIVGVFVGVSSMCSGLFVDSVVVVVCIGESDG